MIKTLKRWVGHFAAMSVVFAATATARAQVVVRFPEGSLHGFLVLKSEAGEPLAYGDLFQTVRGNRITGHMIFHFKDGSLHEETAAYSQSKKFHLITDHLVQKGPSFPHPQEVTIDVPKGQVTVRSTDDGKQQEKTEHMSLPADLSNGIFLTLLKNLRPSDGETKLSFLVATPKPRLVKLAIKAGAEDPFTVAGSKRKAINYTIKFEIGGLAGVVAPVIGKQPPDLHVWVLPGEAPAFVKMEGPMFMGGPVWRVELTSPEWGRADTRTAHQ